MFYREIIPQHPFNQIVHCYWVLEDTGSEQASYEKVLPDGQMELIFHYGDQYECKIGNITYKQPKSLLFGQLDRYIELRPSGNSGIFGIRFKTWGVADLFKFPMALIKGQYIPLDEINKDFKDLEEQILNAIDLPHRIRIFQNHMLTALREQRDEITPVAIALISSPSFDGNINSLAGWLNISVKKLNRIFFNKVGLTPKELLKIHRVKKAINSTIEVKSLTELSLSLGYYDQSHFIRDFKQIAGVTPSQYLKTDHALHVMF